MPYLTAALSKQPKDVQLPELHERLAQCEPSISWFGTRCVRLTDSQGVIIDVVHLSSLARHVAKVGTTGNLSQEERDAGLRVINKLRHFHQITDEQVSPFNLLTRLINLVRRIFSTFKRDCEAGEKAFRTVPTTTKEAVIPPSAAASLRSEEPHHPVLTEDMSPKEIEAFSSAVADDPNQPLKPVAENIIKALDPSLPFNARRTLVGRQKLLSPKESFINAFYDILRAYLCEDDWTNALSISYQEVVQRAENNVRLFPQPVLEGRVELQLQKNEKGTPVFVLQAFELDSLKCRGFFYLPSLSAPLPQIKTLPTAVAVKGDPLTTQLAAPSSHVTPTTIAQTEDAPLEKQSEEEIDPLYEGLSEQQLESFFNKIIAQLDPLLPFSAEKSINTRSMKTTRQVKTSLKALFITALKPELQKFICQGDWRKGLSLTYQNIINTTPHTSALRRNPTPEGRILLQLELDREEKPALLLRVVENPDEQGIKATIASLPEEKIPPLVQFIETAISTSLMPSDDGRSLGETEAVVKTEEKMFPSIAGAVFKDLITTACSSEQHPFWEKGASYSYRAILEAFLQRPVMDASEHDFCNDGVQGKLSLPTTYSIKVYAQIDRITSRPVFVVEVTDSDITVISEEFFYPS